MTGNGLQLQTDVPARCRAALQGDAGRWLAGRLPDFLETRSELLAQRRERQQRFDAGELPAFGDDPAAWTCRDVPPPLRDRRADLHALPAAASWQAVRDRRASLLVTDLEEYLPARGAALGIMERLLDDLEPQGSGQARLLFGPRELGRVEPLVTWHGEPVPAALLDTALYLFGVHEAAARAGQPLCIRLSRLESSAEATLWADCLADAAAALPEPAPEVVCSVALETVAAACRADDILSAVRDAAVTLCLDRHACLHNFLQCFRLQPGRILPDRGELSTDVHFLRAWGQRLVQTAHRREALATGPCASYLSPPPADPERLLERLRADKERHAHDGFDGSGVADPGMLPTARAAFDRLMPGQHQRHRLLTDVHLTRDDLLQVARGKISSRGIRDAIGIALAGAACVARGEHVLNLRGQRETAASIELAACQLWQAVHHVTGILDDGRIVDMALFSELLAEEAGDAADRDPGLVQAAERLAAFVAAPLPGRWLDSADA